MTLNELVDILQQTHVVMNRRASQAIDFSLVVRNWLFGCYIVEFEQNGEDRAQYGAKLIVGLSEQLRKAGVPGCSVSNLRSFRQFYEGYSEIRQTVSGELDLDQNTLLSSSGQTANLSTRAIAILASQFKLSWSHYLILLGIKNPEERHFYEIEVAAAGWTVQELERQIEQVVVDEENPEGESE
jgi:DUF1016 N-terminal domain